MNIKILLLEDSDPEAAIFIRKIANSEVTITRVKTVSEAFATLEIHHDFDMAVIDPIMSDTIDFGRFLSDLSTKNIEIKVIHPGRFIPSNIRDTADKQGAEIVSLNDNAKLLGIIQDLVKKKSSGSGTYGGDGKGDRLTLASKVVKLEILVGDAQRLLEKHTRLIEDLRKNSYENSYLIKEICDTLTENKKTIDYLGKTISDIISDKDKEEAELELKTKQIEENNKRFLGVLVAVIGLVTAIAVPLIPYVDKYIDKYYDQRNLNDKNEKGKLQPRNK